MFESPTGALLKGQSEMATATTILGRMRDRIFHRAALKDAGGPRALTWLVAVTTLADGGELSDQEIDELVDSQHSSDKAVCSSGSSHETSFKPLANGRGRKCQCQTCGRSWEEEIPAGTVGEYSAERLVRDAELLVRRRELAKIVADRPSREARRQEIDDEQRKPFLEAERMRRAAMENFERLQPDMIQVDYGIRECGTAEHELVKTFGELYGDLKRQLDALIVAAGQASLRAKSTSEDLFGIDRSRPLTQLTGDSTGGKLLTFLRKFYPDHIYELTDLQTVNPEKFPPFKIVTGNVTDAVDDEFGRYLKFWKSTIGPALESIDRNEAEAASLKPQIEHLQRQMLEA